MRQSDRHLRAPRYGALQRLEMQFASQRKLGGGIRALTTFERGIPFYHVVKVDADGSLVDAELAGRAVSLSPSTTDVFVAAHGWAVRQRDDGSVPFFDRMFGALCSRLPCRVQPWFVGVYWPSHPISLVEEQREDWNSEVKSLVDAIRDVDLLPSRTLSQIIRASFKNGVAETGSEELAPLLDELVTQLTAKGVAMPRFLRAVVESNALRSKDPFQAVRNYIRRAQWGSSSSRTPGSDGKLDARLDLILRGVLDLFFGQFQLRASNVGSHGVHQLLCMLQDKVGPACRVHLLGHSLGGHVVCSAVIGPPERCLLKRKIHSASIFQGAVPSDAFSPNGQYRQLIEQGLVAGPIILTYSSFDYALLYYDRLGFSEPLGRVGARQTEPQPHVRQELRSLGHDYQLRPGTIYSFKGDAFINKRSGFLGIGYIDGAHRDITDAATLEPLVQASLMDLGENAYTFVSE